MELFSTLPSEIINHIISYTYRVQDNALLQDIKSFYISKKILLISYYQRLVVDNYLYDGEHLLWLLNDMYYFSNSVSPAICGYMPPFYNLFHRHCLLRTRLDVDVFVGILEKKNYSSQINVFLGLFTPMERDAFIARVLSRPF
jgi:hypothetical protein